MTEASNTKRRTSKIEVHTHEAGGVVDADVAAVEPGEGEQVCDFGFGGAACAGGEDVSDRAFVVALDDVVVPPHEGEDR